MADLTSPTLIYLKGLLFVALGVFAGGILLAKVGNWQIAALLALTIWAFCRAYYFAFYVIEHYVDPGFKFAGLINFAKYLGSRRK